MNQRRNLLVFVVLCVVLLLHARYYFPFFSDDAWISLRYSRRFAEGLGLTWTDGERVEGYSDFLWVVLLAAPMKLGLSGVAAARFLDTAGVLAAMFAAGIRVSKPPELHLPRLLGGSLYLASCVPCAVWSVGGLEHGFMAGLIGATLFLLLRNDGPRDRWAAGACLALLALCRVDGFVFTLASAAALLIGALWQRQLVRGLVPVLLVPLAALLAQLAFRRWYYGEWVPNTALVKVSFNGTRLIAGFEHVGKGLLAAVVPLALAIAGTAKYWSKSPRVRWLLPWSMTVSFASYLVLVGGDIFPGFRQLLLALVPLSFVLAESAEHLLEGASPRRAMRRMQWGVVALVVGAIVQSRDSENRRAKTERWEWGGLPIGSALRRAFAQEDPLLAVDAAGALPYYSRLDALDMLGLNDHYLPRHPPPNFGQGQIGHELGDADYVLRRAPDLIAFCNAVGNREPCFYGGHELLKRPTFASEYSLMRLEERGTLGEIYVRRKGKLGIVQTPDQVLIPGHLFASRDAVARLERAGTLATFVTASTPGRSGRITVPQGRYSITLDAPDLELEIWCRGRRLTPLDPNAPLSLGLSEDTRVEFTVRSKDSEERALRSLRLHKAPLEHVRFSCVRPDPTH